jgi:S-sulfo-L-cysteine synthase (3-phospho-L-serine-dependent)
VSGERAPRWLVLVESNTTGSGRLFCRAARRAGLRPVLLARDPDRYPYVRADGVENRVVDTGDPAAVLAACAGLPAAVAGVTSSSEYYVGTASEVARALGRPHPDPAAIRDCRDKATQRARLAAAGLPGPAFAAAGSPAEAVAAADRIGYPVVVKPVAGSGSIGVRRCGTAAEVAGAAGAVLLGAGQAVGTGLPAQDAVLVEEYLPGAEFSVETFDDRVVGVTRKHLGPEPAFVETGHDFPAPLDPAAAAALGDAAVAALRALGLGWGAAHTELRLTAAGPVVVEVNPRLAGGMIPRLVEEATGIDLIALLVARVAGQRPVPVPSRARAASIRFLVAAAAGRLAGVSGVAEARRVPGVVEVGVTAREGQEVLVRGSFQDRLGYVLAAGGDRPAAAAAADAGLRLLAADLVMADLVPQAAVAGTARAAADAGPGVAS